MTREGSATFPETVVPYYPYFSFIQSAYQMINVRQHALESGCFVVCATAWLDGGCFTAIVAPDRTLIGEPLRSGEGVVIADLDFTRIDKRKQLMDSRGHYSRPELLSLLVDRVPTALTHERVVRPHAAAPHPSTLPA